MDLLLSNFVLYSTLGILILLIIFILLIVKYGPGLLFTIAGIGIVYLSYYLYQQSVDLAEKTEVLTAEVIDVQQTLVGKKVYKYYPQIRININNQIKELWVENVLRREGYRDGEVITLLVNPKSPQDAIFYSYFKLWIAPFAILLMGLSFLFAGLFGNIANKNKLPPILQNIMGYAFSLIIFIFFIGLFIAFIVIGISEFKNKLRIKDNSEVTTGILVDYRIDDDEDGTTYRPIYEYIVQATNYRITRSSGSSFKSLFGKTKQIVFDKKFPANAHIGSPYSLFIMPVIFILLGSFFLIILIYKLVKTFILEGFKGFAKIIKMSSSNK